MTITFGRNRHSSRSIASKPATTGGKIGASVFFFIFFLAGMFFLTLILREAYQRTATYGWDTVDATILDSGYETSVGSNKDQYGFSVRYRYRVGGREFTSSQYTVSGDAYDDFRPVQKAMLTYVPGATVQAHVNPGDPSDAALTHETPWMMLFVFLPLIFILIGAGGMYFTWFGKATDGPLSDKAMAAPSKSRTAGLVVCLVLVLVGVPLTNSLGIAPTLRWASAQGWPAMPAEVELSRVRVNRGDDGATYAVDILFRYDVAGHTYHSNDYDFSFGSSSGRRSKQAIVNAHPRGKAVTAYVDPDDPSDAVLTRSYHPLMLLGWLPLLLAFGGGIGLFRLLRGGDGAATLVRSGFDDVPESKKRSVAVDLGTLLSGSDSDWPHYLPKPRVTDISNGLRERFELRPTTARWVTFIGVTFFALFWNGILSIFVYKVVASHLQGHPEWFLTFFVIPFVLVGLGVIVGVFATLMGMFNPHLVLQTRQPLVAPGHVVEMTWQIEGAAHRIQRLTIDLVGTEKATYRRGTDTYTDTHEFFEQTLLTAEQGNVNTHGELSFAIPRDAMHSLALSNNEVFWQLKARGTITLWPDMKDDFNLTVVPVGLAPKESKARR